MTPDTEFEKRHKTLSLNPTDEQSSIILKNQRDKKIQSSSMQTVNK